MNNKNNSVLKLVPEQVSHRVAYVGAYPLGRAPQGGVESAYQALFGLMLEADPNLQIQVLTSGEGEEIFFDGRLVVRGGLPAHYFLARLRGFPMEQRIIRRFIEKLPSQTVVMTAGSYGFLAVEAAKEKGLAAVFTIHGIAEYDVMRERKPWLRKSISANQLRHMSKRAVTAADHVVAISGYSANYVRELGRELAVTVIPNAVDPLFEELQHLPRQHASRLLFVGNILPLKGLHHLIEAMGELKAGFSDLSLAVVGPVSDAVYFEELKLRAQELRIHVSWLGSLDKLRVREEMLQSDVLVLPSLVENLPQVLQEAGALGLPFVASSVGGVADLVPKNLHNQILVPPADEVSLAERIAALLGDSEQRREMGVALRGHVQVSFSNNVVAQKTIGVCRPFWEQK